MIDVVLKGVLFLGLIFLYLCLCSNYTKNSPKTKKKRINFIRSSNNIKLKRDMAYSKLIE